MNPPPAGALLTRQVLHQMMARIAEAEQELGRLDAAMGDGDHGAGMMRGLRAAVRAVDEVVGNPGAGVLLVQAGGAFADEAGGASGALVGTLLQTVGRSLGDGPCTPASLHAALEAGLAAVCDMGEAQPGDKTLVDTLHPFVQALGAVAVGAPTPADAWARALPAAEAGAHATAEMVSRRGRSSRLGERSRGHLDPGAISMLYLLQATGAALDAPPTVT
ncbi:MAG: dihydroxyacetone kinase subunit DhaL [Caldilineaceae bacterium]